MPNGIEFFYIVCACVGFIFTLFTALSGHHGHGGHGGHGHISGGHSLTAKLGGKLAAKTAHGNVGANNNSQFVTLPLISPLSGAIFVGMFGFLGIIGKTFFGLSPVISLIFALPASLFCTIFFSW